MSKLDTFRESTNQTSREPALVTGISTGSVAGVLAIIGYLFPGAMTERTYTIVLIVGVCIVPIITAILTRGKVWSPASVAELAEEVIKETEETIIGIQNKKSPNAPKLLE